MGVPITFGTTEIELKSEETIPSLMIRELIIRKDERSREVTHIQYLLDSDFTDLARLQDCLLLLSETRSYQNLDGGRTLVHCSDGIGATGVFIAGNYLVDQGRMENSVDVVSCVETLRQQRADMVPKLAQYKFLHEVVNRVFIDRTYETLPDRTPDTYYKLKRNHPVYTNDVKESEYSQITANSPVHQEVIVGNNVGTREPSYLDSIGSDGYHEFPIEEPVNPYMEMVEYDYAHTHEPAYLHPTDA